MRRLKEGFYSLMKIANAVKDNKDSKNELIEFSNNNKIEKPLTEAIIKLKFSNMTFDADLDITPAK